jgi:beta-glucanase (GH16 family)
MARWRLALGLVMLLVIGVWAVGLSAKDAAPAKVLTDPRPSSSPSERPRSSAPPGTRGVLRPQGNPQFAATFSGSTLDTAIWATCYPQMKQSGCTNFGNKETQWYLPSQDQVSGGLLHLVARREPTQGTTASGTPEVYGCRSGMVTSYPGFRFKYGYLQIVARIPSSPGLWPALWLVPANIHKWPPEIDIVESWGKGAFAGAFFHPYPRHTKPDRGLIRPPLRAAGWHTFALSWTKTQLTWLLDGRVILTVRNRVPHLKMFLIADLAAYLPVGGVNQCSGSLLIRSVKLWKE